MDNVNINESNYHHGDLRSTLIKAGLKVLDNEGIEAVGIRRLAREVNVAHSAPANHFSNKKALWTALAVDCFRSLVAEIAPTDESQNGNHAKSDPESQVRQLASATISYGLRYPNRFRLMFRWDQLDQDNDEVKQTLAQTYRLLLSAINNLPLKKTMSLETYAISLWSMVHGYTMMRIEGTLIPGVDDISGLPREEAIITQWLDSV